jgi:hypothetical protein
MVRVADREQQGSLLLPWLQRSISGWRFPVSTLDVERSQVEELMSSAQLVALAVLLCAANAVWAADPAVTERHAELIVPSAADLYLDAAPALQGAEPAWPGSVLTERKLEGPGRGEGSVSLLKVRLGRTPAVGRSPGDVPPLYGEVGIDLDSGAGLSLVPSYRVVLSDDDAEASEAGAAQILKLGARIRF